jgi:hypothetical protein
MYGLADEFLALERAEYLREVVGPKAIRQELLMTELARSRQEAAGTASRGPQLWTRPMSIVRSALGSATRRLRAHGAHHATQPFAR